MLRRALTCKHYMPKMFSTISTKAPAVMIRCNGTRKLDISEFGLEGLLEGLPEGSPEGLPVGLPEGLLLTQSLVLQAAGNCAQLTKGSTASSNKTFIVAAESLGKLAKW